MPRPKSLTIDRLTEAALTVLDATGPDGLSMRAVAAALDMGAMSLYRYVRDRDDLTRLVVDRVLRDVDLVPPRRAGWQRQLGALTERAWRAIGDHPAAVPLLLTRRHASDATRRWGEAVLAVLTAAGFTGTNRVVAFRCLVSYLLGALQTEYLGPLGGAGTRALTELPESEFPHIAANARQAGGIRPGEEFRRGLAIVLAGLSAERD